MAEHRRTSAEPLASRLLAFGEYQLDCDAGQLWRGDEEIKLTPRAAALLAVLAERSMQVVTKEELIDRLWDGKAVGDDALTSCMRELRRALGDDSRNPKLVETRHRRGYRLLLPLTEAVTERVATEISLLPALSSKASIAVLPFQNLSGDPEQEYFADGMVEEIITALSRFKSLFVIARNSSFTYKGKAVDIKQVGRDLGVRYVLEGSVRKAGNRVRIAGQLIDSETGTHLWADRFDGTLEDVFSLQDLVTEKVVAALTPSLEQAEIERAKRKPTANLHAYDYYLRALNVYQVTTAENIGESMRLTRQALELDPNYSSALALLLQCYAHRRGFGVPVEVNRERAEVEQLVRIAIRIGRDDALVVTSAAYAIGSVLRDLAFAEEQIARALSLNPNLAAAWSISGWISFLIGRPAVAIEHFLRALRLDPLFANATRRSGLAHAYFFLDRYQDALRWAENHLRDSPNAHPALRIGAASAAFAGMTEVARQLAARLNQVDPTFRVSRLEDYIGPYRLPENVEKYKQGLRLAGLPE